MGRTYAQEGKMATIRNLFPLATYPNGTYSFGPYATPSGINGIKATFARCTSADPTIWPLTSTRISIELVCSYDGGVTYDPAILGWSQGGGIITDSKTGEEKAFTNASWTADPPPTHVKGAITVTGGPIKTSMTLTTP